MSAKRKYKKSKEEDLQADEIDETVLSTKKGTPSKKLKKTTESSDEEIDSEGDSFEENMSDEDGDEDGSGYESDSEDCDDEEDDGDDDEDDDDDDEVQANEDTKREQSGNDDPLKNNSLIVTNLAFSTTKDQLQEYFEDGTVRIAVERKRGNSLGYAFVDFETIEAATAAMTKWNGHEVDDRKISIEYAKKRVSADDGPGVPSKVLYLWNLDASTVEETLKNAFSDAIAARIPTHASGTSRRIGFVTFKTVEEAQQAQKAYNGHILDGSAVGISFFNKKKLKEGKNPARKKTVDVIIRNLSFETTEETLQNLFGSAVSVHIPKNASNDKPRGFAFVAFNSEREAKIACKRKDGARVEGRQITVTVCQQKEEYKKSGAQHKLKFDSKKKHNNDDRPPSDRLCVQGLSYDTTEDTLEEIFNTATSTHLVCDKETGNSRGFAFANYSSIEDATAARKKLNGKKIDGRAVRLSFADQKITGKEKRIQTVNSKPQHRPKIREYATTVNTTLKPQGKKTVFED